MKSEEENTFSPPEHGTGDEEAVGAAADEIEAVPEPAEPRLETVADEPEAELIELEDEDGGPEDDAAAAVAWEGDRPIVTELQYQAPKSKGADDDEGAEESRFSSVAEAKAVVEGFLFSSNEPLSVSRLSRLMGNLHPKTVRGLLLELQWDYENRPGALQILEIAGGYQMATRAHLAPWMFRLHKLKRRSPLSPATLETLAIVAYRQPITKGEVEAVRGVETGAPLRTLQELGLIEASGRREVAGRPQLYITTEQFLKAFGLKSIADLPSISELKSRFAEEQKLAPRTAAVEAPAEAAPGAPAPEPVTVETDEDVVSNGDGDVVTGEDLVEDGLDAVVAGGDVETEDDYVPEDGAVEAEEPAPAEPRPILDEEEAP